MRKKLILVMLVFVAVVFLGGAQVNAEEVAEGLSTEKQALIRGNCDALKEKLRALQRQDSKARVYLGRYYETILSKFIVPLNVRLVENNLSSTSFINNQNNFNMMRSDFVNSYVDYQRALEELVGMDCKTDVGRFYNQLVVVRGKRAKVADDVTKIRGLADRNIELVTELKEKL